MRKINSIPSKASGVTTPFLGLNLNQYKKEGEFMSAKNVSTRNYPLLTMCVGNKVIDDGQEDPQNFEDIWAYDNICYCVTTINGQTGIYEWDKDTGKVIYEGQTPKKLCDCTEGKKKTAMINTKMLILPDGIVADVKTGVWRTINEKGTSDGHDLNVEKVDDAQQISILKNGATVTRIGNFVIADMQQGETISIRNTQLRMAEVRNAKIEKVAADDKLIVKGISKQVICYKETAYLEPSHLGDIAFKVNNSEWYVFAAQDMFGESEDILRGNYIYIQKNVDARNSYSAVLYQFTEGAVRGRIVKTVEARKRTDRPTGTAEYLATIYNLSDAQWTIERDFPEIDFICEHNNRIFAVGNNVLNEVYSASTGEYEEYTGRCVFVSALGMPEIFFDFSSDSGSWQAAIASQGDFTAIAEYGGSVICFKEDEAVKVIGDYPSEFYLTSYNIEGVREGCAKSCTVCNEVLFFQGLHGIFAYSGGVPKNIAENLNITIYDSEQAATCAENDGRFILFGTASETYQYDTQTGLWNKTSSTQYSGTAAMARCKGEVYILRKNDMISLASEEPEFTVIEKFAEHKTANASITLAPFDMGSMKKRRYRRMRIKFSQDNDAPWEDGRMIILCAYDGEAFEQIYRFERKSSDAVMEIVLPIKRCEKMQLKIEVEGSGEGIGKLYLMEIERELIEGSAKR